MLTVLNKALNDILAWLEQPDMMVEQSYRDFQDELIKLRRGVAEAITIANCTEGSHVDIDQLRRELDEVDRGFGTIQRRKGLYRSIVHPDLVKPLKLQCYRLTARLIQQTATVRSLYCNPDKAQVPSVKLNLEDKLRLEKNSTAACENELLELERQAVNSFEDKTMTDIHDARTLGPTVLSELKSKLLDKANYLEDFKCERELPGSFVEPWLQTYRKLFSELETWRPRLAPKKKAEQDIAILSLSISNKINDTRCLDYGEVKQSLTAVILCFLTVLALAFAQIQPSFGGDDSAMLKGLNDDAEKALGQKNYQLAIQKLGQALQLKPDYPRARQNLAVAYGNYGLVFQNNPTEAMKYFHKACLLDPDNATLGDNLGEAIQRLGKNPNDFATRVALGDAARKVADLVGAIVEYREALKIKDDASIHEKLADLQRIRDENDDAIREYQAAAKIQDSAPIEVKLGQAFQIKGDLALAKSAYSRAVKMKSDDPNVLDALVSGWEAAIKENPMAPENNIGYGQALQYKGDFSQARTAYQQAINHSPGRRNLEAERLLSLLAAAEAQGKVDKYINLGVDAQTKKNYPAALAAYQNAQKFVMPSDLKQQAFVITNMGTVYQDMEYYTNAVKCYQKALSLDATKADAAQGLNTARAGQTRDGDVPFKGGNYDDVIAEYRKLLQVDPKDPAIHFCIAATMQLKKDYDGAIGEYNIAISLDPQNKAYRETLAKVKDLKAQPTIDQAVALQVQKKYVEAIQLYEQARELVPQNAGVLYNMAAAQYAVADYKTARASFDFTFQLDAKQADCLYFIAAIDENNGNGAQALSEYQKYISQDPIGTYSAQAKNRIRTLAANADATIKIKSASVPAKESVSSHVIGTNHAAGAQDDGGSGLVTTTKQPGVLTSSALLQEYQKTMVIDLGVSQSRLVQINNKITRTSISDPGIAEPVVVSENQILLLGKAPGRATLTMWDDVGNVVGVVLRVRRQCGMVESAARAFGDVLYHCASGESPASYIPPVTTGSIELEKGETVRLGGDYVHALGGTVMGHGSSAKATSGQSYVYDVLPPALDFPQGMRFALVAGGLARKHGSSDLVVDIEQYQARTFKVDHRLTRFSVTDPGIAEPVVISEREVVLLGKGPGRATLGLWDDADKTVGIQVRVRRPDGPIRSIGRALEEKVRSSFFGIKSARSIPPVVIGTIELAEFEPSMEINLERSQATMFKAKGHLVRTSMSDPEIVQLLPTEDGIYLWGKRPGRATAFIWDDLGNVTGIDLQVNGASREVDKASFPPSSDLAQHQQSPTLEPAKPSIGSGPSLLPPYSRPVRQVEAWTGSRKDIWEFPLPQSGEKDLALARRNPGQVHNLGPGGSTWWRIATTNPETYQRSIILNNEGLKALADDNYQLAVTKLITALYVDYSCQLASDNLAIAYNNYGLSLGEAPKEAIKQFHQAIYVSPTSPTVRKNLEKIIGMMGKDPNKFQDRVELGDEASLSGDLTGAVIEYEAALQIKDDIQQCIKLGEAFKKLGDAQDKQSWARSSEKFSK